MDSSAMRLDAPTLLFSVSAFSFVMVALSLTLSRAVGGNRWGHLSMSASLACCGTAFLFYYLAGSAPFFFTFLLANFFVLHVVPNGAAAFAKLFESKYPRKIMIAVTWLGLSAVFGTFFFGTPRSYAVASVSLALAAQMAVLVTLIIRRRRIRISLAFLAACLVLCLFIAFVIYRAATALFGDYRQVIPGGSGTHQLAILFLATLYVAVTFIAFLNQVNERLRVEATERLLRDSLTGLYTRTAFIEMLPDIEARALKENYAVLLVDVDHFKAINDTYGHRGGDAVLAHLGRFLAGAFRLSDTVVRYGGEEFCIVLWGCSEQEAALFSARVVKDGREQRVRLPCGGSTTFTLSLGFAFRAAGPSGEAVHEVVERADKALYQAKNEGRDQVRAAPPTSPMALA